MTRWSTVATQFTADMANIRPNDVAAVNNDNNHVTRVQKSPEVFGSNYRHILPTTFFSLVWTLRSLTVTPLLKAEPSKLYFDCSCLCINFNMASESGQMSTCACQAEIADLCFCHLCKCWAWLLLYSCVDIWPVPVTIFLTWWITVRIVCNITSPCNSQLKVNFVWIFQYVLYNLWSVSTRRIS